MLGAISGDVIGSVHEYIGTKTTEFELFPPNCRFTDDSVLTIAVADCLMSGRSYVDAFHDYFAAYPSVGWGGMFHDWASRRDRAPYNSWGNGAAMRVASLAYAFDRLEDVLEEAAQTAEVTHNHPEGVKGAQATAAAVFLARRGEAKPAIKATIEKLFGYDLSRSLDKIRTSYEYDISCQGTVPPALIAFLESVSFEDAIRKSISLGGDADTLACITGGVAEAFYRGVPADIALPTLDRLDDRLRRVVTSFRDLYCPF
jgi:ADP-ribosylglycohydrolase